MKLSEKCSEKVVNHIKGILPEKTEEDLAIMRYGIEVLYMNITKTIIILVVAYMLHIVKYILCVLAIFGVLRCFAAGIHARRSVTCLFFTLLFMLGTVYLSLEFQITLAEKVPIFFLSLYVYYKHAPADTEEKPYLDPVIRQQLKIKSIGIASLYFILSICTKSMFFSNVLMHVLWIEALLISPITYKILNRRYNNYEYYKEIL